MGGQVADLPEPVSTALDQHRLMTAQQGTLAPFSGTASQAATGSPTFDAFAQKFLTASPAERAAMQAKQPALVEALLKLMDKK